MNLWKNLLILATAICLVSPVAVSAFDEVPSFSNPAQAQHAENIAEASFSEIDVEDAKERAQTAYAEDMAESFIEEKAQDYAEGVFEQKAEDYAEEFVIQKSENHADGVIEKLADDYVKELLETKAKDHADDVCAGCDETDPNWIAAKEAYLEQTSEESMEQLKTNRLQELDGGNEWNEAYQYAYKRATGDGYRNLKMTTYENWLADPDNAQIKIEAYDYAIERAYEDFGPGHPNAYQTALKRFYGEEAPKELYEEYLTEKISEITGEKVEVIRKLRYEDKLGWGQIKKMYPVPKEVLGLGHSFNVKLPKGQVTPPNPEEISIDAEIAEVTQRSKNNGWNKNQKSAKQKGNSKKWIGLDEASLKAQAAVSDVGEGNGKSSNGKGGSSTGAGQSNNSNKSQTSLSSTSSPSGKDKSKNGNNGRSSKSDKNDRGNSGKSDKNDRGNNGNNGNNGNGKK